MMLYAVYRDLRGRLSLIEAEVVRETNQFYWIADNTHAFRYRNRHRKDAVDLTPQDALRRYIRKRGADLADINAKMVLAQNGKHWAEDQLRNIEGVGQ